jgi:outer membrane protein
LKVDSIRVLLAEARLEAGNGSKPAVLQAKLEQNLHLAQQLERKSALLTQMENLNILLGRDPSTLFTATDSISVGSITLDESSRNNDLRLRLAEQQKRTAFQWLKENKGARWPVLTLNADYSFNKTENEAGFLLENQNLVPGLD